MAEERKILSQTTGHNVSMENREKLKVTGIIDVSGFDESYVDTETELGRLIIRGEELKIGKLSLEQHELVVNGYIFSIEYDDKHKGKGKGMFASVFR